MPAVVDVQDMLCAQALAVVAQAIDRLPRGDALEVRYNTDDVRHDLIVWAEARRYQVQETGSRMRITRDTHVERPQT